MFNFAKFDAETAHLDLIVYPPAKADIAILIQYNSIAGPV